MADLKFSLLTLLLILLGLVMFLYMNRHSGNPTTSFYVFIYFSDEHKVPNSLKKSAGTCIKESFQSG